GFRFAPPGAIHISPPFGGWVPSSILVNARFIQIRKGACVSTRTRIACGHASFMECGRLFGGWDNEDLASSNSVFLLGCRAGDSAAGHPSWTFDQGGEPHFCRQ